MEFDFCINNNKIANLAATRQGRVSQAGFCYQTAYAIARLASMHVREPILSINDIPIAIRYDWAEDIDEIVDGGTNIFTQCKRIKNVGQPSRLIPVLLGFASKFLWTPESLRKRILFRLVCCDLRFKNLNCSRKLDNALGDSKLQIIKDLTISLSKTHTGRSDKAKWYDQAANFGFEQLAEELCSRTEVIFVDHEPNLNDTDTGPILPAEQEALNLWIRGERINTLWKLGALNAVRGLIFGNLVEFNLTEASDEPGSAQLGQKFKNVVALPKIIRRTDIRAELAQYRYEPRSSKPVIRVTNDYLREQASLDEEEFVARLPTWGDVARGSNPNTKFIERQQTEKLFKQVREELGSVSKESNPIVVVGPPGSGKTTIVRRVAARLVQEEAWVVIDPGFHLPPLLPDVGEELSELLSESLVDSDRVLLILDDPFYSDSGWPKLIRDICKNLTVGVFIASPDFLFEQHRANLNYTKVEMAPAPLEDQQAMCEVWGCSEDLVRGVDDFFVLCMQAAEGRAFFEIAERIWLTLNNGKPIEAICIEELSWHVLAFSVVTFFSRMGIDCPESLLQSTLEICHDFEDTAEDIYVQLSYLKAEGGWHIFQDIACDRDKWKFRGRMLSLAHQSVAHVAWARRPTAIGRLDIALLIIKASLKVPECVSWVALLAGRLSAHADYSHSDYSFVQRFIQELIVKPPEDACHISAVAYTLQANRCIKKAQLLIPILQSRVTETPDGWLVAASLLYIGENLTKDLTNVIKVANFTLAPNRALKFGRSLKDYRRVDDLKVFHSKLLDLLSRGDLTSYLLTWLLEGKEGNYIIRNCWKELRNWLIKEHNRNVTDVRVKIMEKLQQQNEHMDCIRLYFITEIRDWLDSHVGAKDVRTKYLDFLHWPWGKPGKIDCWMRDGFDLCIKTSIKPALLELRKEATVTFFNWLNSPNGRNNTDVRTQYLVFLMAMPNDCLFKKYRIMAIEKTFTWLQHDTSPRKRDVLAALVDVVGRDDDTDAEIKADIIEFAINYVTKREYNRSDQAIVQSLKNVAIRCDVSLISERGKLAVKKANDIWNTFDRINPKAFHSLGAGLLRQRKRTSRY